MEQAKHQCQWGGVAFWKSILVSLERLLSLVHFELESGSKVLFWCEAWCGDQLLKIQFPEVFRMALPKEATVHGVVSWNGF